MKKKKPAKPTMKPKVSKGKGAGGGGSRRGGAGRFS